MQAVAVVMERMAVIRFQQRKYADVIKLVRAPAPLSSPFSCEADPSAATHANFPYASNPFYANSIPMMCQLHRVPEKSAKIMAMYAKALEREGLRNDAASAHREVLRSGASSSH